MKKLKLFRQFLSGENQPRDKNGRWVKSKTKIAEIIKDKTKKELFAGNLKDSKKNTFDRAIAKKVEKEEANKENRSFHEIYKPSEAVIKKLKNPKNTVEDIDDAIAQEAHKPYMALAKARLIKDGSTESEFNNKKAFNDAVEETAGEYALKARSIETIKIDKITQGNRYIETKKSEVEIDEGVWISKYTKYKKDDLDYEESGFFRTADELKEILKD